MYWYMHLIKIWIKFYLTSTEIILKILRLAEIEERNNV